MKSIDLQLIQTKDSNFIIYDDSNRAYFPTQIIDYNELVPDGTYTPYIYCTFTSPSGVVTNITIADISVSSVTLMPVDGGTTESVDYNLDFANLTSQTDFQIELTEFSNNVEEGLWTIDISVWYLNGGNYEQYIQQYSELAYIDIELYRSSRFERIALNPELFNEIEKRYFTEDELFFLGTQVYDGYFKAMRAALEAGNSNAATTILEWLQDYKTLNPVS